MNVEKKADEGCVVKLIVKAEAAEIAEEHKKVLNTFLREAAIPGFRKGKVPLAVIQQKFADGIKQETEQACFRKLYPAALKEAAIDAIDLAGVTDVMLDPATGFSFTALCGAETSAYALAGERGTALKSDLAIHPARLVVIGDSSFLGNAALASRANANRDFFLNAVAWLAGLDVSGSPGMGGNVISTRMDRRLRIRFVLLTVVGVPVALGLFVLVVRVWKRRRRK